IKTRKNIKNDSLPKFYSRFFVSNLFRPFRACKKLFAPYKGLCPLLLIPPLRGLNHQTSSEFGIRQ
ncbi:MAG TPA: hypothetical protein PLY31_04895, partial [Tenuifilaceae bacterium]|nr:hypothetical protein [Tenuifilaceae bacterium]